MSAAEPHSELLILGASDLIVVRSGGTTLVMPRDRASEMKELLAKVDDS